MNHSKFFRELISTVEANPTVTVTGNINVTNTSLAVTNTGLTKISDAIIGVDQADRKIRTNNDTLEAPIKILGTTASYSQNNSKGNLLGGVIQGEGAFHTQFVTTTDDGYIGPVAVDKYGKVFTTNDWSCKIPSQDSYSASSRLTKVNVMGAVRNDEAKNALCDSDNKFCGISCDQFGKLFINDTQTLLGACIDTENDHLEVDTNAINGVTMQVGPGNSEISAGVSGVQRMCIATNDLNMNALLGLNCDFRFISTLNSSITFFNKLQKVNFHTNENFWNNLGGLASNGNQLGGVPINPAVFANDAIIQDNAGNAVFAKTWPISQWSLSLPYDACSIVARSANDVATTGTHARTVYLKYYDSSNVLQTVTHNLGSATTYNIRKIEEFYVASWGANIWNENAIEIINSANNNHVAWIHNTLNQFYPTYMVIPHNGFILLDKMEINGISAKIYANLLLVKQSSATAFSVYTIFKYTASASACGSVDLSYLPKIDGPTSLTDNWAIVISGASTSSSNTAGSIQVSAKIYRP